MEKWGDHMDIESTKLMTGFRVERDTMSKILKSPLNDGKYQRHRRQSWGGKKRDKSLSVPNVKNCIET